jgi:hypothetical protein
MVLGRLKLSIDPRGGLIARQHEPVPLVHIDLVRCVLDASNLVQPF